MFALEDVVDVSIRSKEEEMHIVTQLGAFLEKYGEMLKILRRASKQIDNASRYAEAQLRSAAFLLYRRKLALISRAVQHINTKVRGIQMRLNNIRKQMPSQQSLVETGPFFYRCVYQGGVRYRDYPSSTAHHVKDVQVVLFEQVVEICERVFISGEQSVFLHHKGMGWLFENLKDLVCFERVPGVSGVTG